MSARRATSRSRPAAAAWSRAAMRSSVVGGRTLISSSCDRDPHGSRLAGVGSDRRGVHLHVELLAACRTDRRPPPSAVRRSPAGGGAGRRRGCQPGPPRARLTACPGGHGEAAAGRVRARRPRPPAPRRRGDRPRTAPPWRYGNDGSCGSTTSTSRSQPSFSSLMCWIATALALASRSGSAWYSDTQQR